MNKEVLKQFAGSFIRYLIGMIFGALVSKRIIPEELSNIMLESTITLVATLVFGFVPIAWSWAKIRYNVIFARKARTAMPWTPMGEIVAEVYEENKFVTKI